MSTGLSMILWVLAIGALVRLHVALWSRYFHASQYAEQVHFCQTEDGWKLALHRYLPKKQIYKEPLFLCHGMGANRHNYDMGPGRSLARSLAGQGFDVWVVELRGAGLSTRPRWFSEFKSTFNFDDHLNLDIPAALELVRRVTGEPECIWVGHSMGGMLGYAWLGSRTDSGVRGLVTVSAPVQLNVSGNVKWSHHLIRLMIVGRTIAFRPFARFFSPFMGWSWRTLSKIVVSKEEMEGPMLRRCLVNLTENTSGALMRQFFSWIRLGTFESEDKEVNYQANLAKIEQPVLILAADNDHVAPPDAVAPAYERIKSEDKQLRIFGNDRGDDYDFGHGDILLGIHAPELVFVEIFDWLESRATRLAE